MNIGQSKITPPEAESQSLMIDSHEMQHGRMQVMNVSNICLIRFPKDNPLRKLHSCLHRQYLYNYKFEICNKNRGLKHQ